VRLVHRDPVNPGLERALPAEISDIAKYFQKDFLDYIGSFRLIVQEPECQRVDRLLESLQEFFISLFGGLAQGLDEPKVVALGAGFSRPFRVQVQD